MVVRAPASATAGVPAWREALRTELVRAARERRTLTYRELTERAGVPPPQSIHKVTMTLEELARADHAEGRPLLAALAVSKTGSGLPGRGFFELLAELGRLEGETSEAEAHAAELEAVFRAYASRGHEEGE